METQNLPLRTSEQPGGRLNPYRTPFQKDYLPGYTGHIPYKKEIYGCTIGDINKIVMGKPLQKVSNFDVDEYRGAMHEQYMSQQVLPTTGQTIMNTGSQAPPPYGQRTLYSNPPPKDVESLHLQYTNLSNRGENWIGGPINNATAQQLPGYQGYIPSVKAENLYGKTYGKTTAIAINKEYAKDPGIGKPPLGVDRYKTQMRADYNKDNFRRIVQSTIEPADAIDVADTVNLLDEEFQGIQVAQGNIYSTIQAVGYQGFKSSYRPPIVSTYHRKQPQFNANALKPRLPPSASNTVLPTESSYQSVPQQTLDNQLRSMSAQRSGSEIKTVPVVGYTGHRMGNRAQGFFGKNFRDCTIQSRNIQKAFESAKAQTEVKPSYNSLATY